MMLEWIRDLLNRQLEKKKQDVIRLRWQQAELQRTLDQARRQQNERKE